MHNDRLEKLIEAKQKELPNHWIAEEVNKLRQTIADKNKEFEEFELKLSLSNYSTTQLKAELRRRKKKGGAE